MDPAVDLPGSDITTSGILLPSSGPRGYDAFERIQEAGHPVEVGVANLPRLEAALHDREEVPPSRSSNVYVTEESTVRPHSPTNIDRS
jgi:hypothetical protein